MKGRHVIVVTILAGLLAASTAAGLAHRVHILASQNGCTSEESRSEERWEGENGSTTTTTRTTSNETCRTEASLARVAVGINGDEVVAAEVGTGATRHSESGENTTRTEERSRCPGGGECTATSEATSGWRHTQGTSWAGAGVSTPAGDITAHGASCTETSRERWESGSGGASSPDGGDEGGYARNTRDTERTCLTGLTLSPHVGATGGDSVLGVERRDRTRCGGEPGAETCRTETDVALAAEAEPPVLP